MALAPRILHGQVQTVPPSTDTPQQDPAPPRGKVLFERHTPAPDTTPDQPASQQSDPAPTEGKSTRRKPTGTGLQHHATTQDTAAPVQVAPDSAATQPPRPAQDDFPAVAASDRTAIQITSATLDLHLDLRSGDTAARANLQLRNISAAPIARILLQISGSLQWQSAQLTAENDTATKLPILQHLLPTDADHTGAATEALLQLPKPLSPGDSVTLGVFYGGKLGSSSQRLLRLGAPEERAALADWDTLSDSFVGLRGFGNVLWMPTAAPAASLGSPADFAAIVDDQRKRQLTSATSLRLTVETSGPPPRTAWFFGVPQALQATDAAPQPASPAPTPLLISSSSDDAPATTATSDDPDEDASDTPAPSRVYTASWPATPAGAQLPSLFVTTAPSLDDSTSPIQVASNRTDVAESYDAAVARIRPLLQEWLGSRPAYPLQIVDLPLTGAQPFAAGDLLVAPLRTEDAKLLTPSLVYPMASAWLPANLPPWLAEGLPEFLRLIYTERNEGRDSALVDLAASGETLARDEALAPADAPALTACVNSTCARTKSAYVFSMLRQIAGEDALKQALTGWLATPSAHADPAAFQHLLEQSSGKKLDWFFADWVNRDAGLPDLTIVQVAPRQIERGTVNNTVPSQRRPVGGPIGDLPEPKPGDPTQPEQGTTASRNEIGPRDGSWLIAVAVQNNGGAAAEVPVTVRSGGLQNTLPLRIAAHSRATIRVPFETAPDEVWVNDGTTPEQRSDTHHRTLNGTATSQ